MKLFDELRGKGNFRAKSFGMPLPWKSIRHNEPAEYDLDFNGATQVLVS